MVRVGGSFETVVSAVHWQRLVLVASRIDVAGQTFRIRESNRSDTNQMSGRIDGKIDSFKKVELLSR